MQTFLPYRNFRESAECLDYKRLGKQRVEAWQILNALVNRKNGVTHKLDKNGKLRKIGWLNHPAVIMWEGHEQALKEYYNTIVTVWEEKGYNNNMVLFDLPNQIDYPKWLGNKKFHSSHRSNLLRKDKNFYSQYHWTEPDNLEYVWPV
jgi:hypothetical protein